MNENIRTAKLKNLIRNVFQEGKLSHSYMISGPKNIGKSELSLELSKILQCNNSKYFCDVCSDCKNIDKRNHMYVREIVPISQGKNQKNTIPIKEIYNLKKFLIFSATQNYYKIIIIHLAEYLSVEAQNSLLKILEEPQNKSIIILTTSNPKTLLQTIRSRSQKISLTPTASSRININSKTNIKDDLSELLSAGKVNKINKILNSSDVEIGDIQKRIADTLKTLDLGIVTKLELAKNLAFDPEKTRSTLDILLLVFHDQLKSQIIKNKSLTSRLGFSYTPKEPSELHKKIQLIQDTKDYLEKGFSSRLVLENLFLNL
ncbi:ATP-binding protein [Patescibacteria group bacterium]